MQPQTLGLIIGGLVPALCFGYSNIAVKLSTNAGLSIPFVLLFAGLGNIAVATVLLFVFPDHSVTMRSGLWMFTGGVAWAFGMSGVTIAIVKFGAPVSQLTPLFNMNTLVAVLLALLIFAEWQNVKVPQLLLGSVFIVIGGTLVARA